MCFGNEGKTGQKRNWFIFKDKLTTISIKKSCRELSIHIVIDQFIFTFFTCFTFIPKTGMGLPKTGIIFYSVISKTKSNFGP